MALVTHKFKLDLTPGAARQVLYTSQGDIGRPFEADLYWNGSPWTATGTTASIRGKKPDDTVFDYTATVSGTAVTFETTEQMTIISGPVECELVFSQGGDVIASANFLLIVEASPYDPDALSESEVTSLGDLIVDELENNPDLIPVDTLQEAIAPTVEDWLDENGANIDYSNVLNAPPVNQLIENEDDRINTGKFTPVLEIGNISFSSSGLNYTNSTYRVRTPKSCVWRLKAGDVVKLDDFTVGTFMAFHEKNGVYYSTGWKYANFTITEDGEYSFLLKKRTEDTTAVYTNPSDIGFTIEIEDKHSIYNNVVELENDVDTINGNITAIEGDVSDIEDVVYIVENIPNTFYLKSNRLHENLGNFPAGGTLTIDALPSTLRAAIQGYTDETYTTKVYDPGWITSAPYSVTINPELYYRFMLANMDYSAITDVGAADGFAGSRTYNLDGKVEELAQDIDDKIEARAFWQSETVKSIAHRGVDTIAPQCTEPAYVLARKMGFRIAENDVNISSDGAFVMWHDTDLGRLGNLVDISGYEMYTDGTTFYYYDADNSQLYTYDDDYVSSSASISSLTRCAGANYSTPVLPLAVLKRIDFGAFKGTQYKGTTILTFDEWVLLCKKLGMEIYIDCKIAYTNQNVVDLFASLKKYGMVDKTTWINVNTEAIAGYIRASDPNARMGILVEPTADRVTQWTPYNTGRGFFFNPNGKTVTLEQVQLGINGGFDVECWYVDYLSATETAILNKISELIGFGVTGLTLDQYRAEDIVEHLYG